MIRRLLLFLTLALSGLFITQQGFSQSAGDLRSLGSGSWFSASVWEIYDGTQWVSDSVFPPSLHSYHITIRLGDSISIPHTDTIVLGYDLEVQGLLFVMGALYTDSFVVWGSGRFAMHGSSSLLGLGDSMGLQLSSMAGNIQTAIRQIPPRVSLYYNGSHHQITGNGIPDTVSSLIVNLNDTFSAFSGLRLSRHLWLRDTLYFVQGRMVTDSATAILTIGPQGSSKGHTYYRFVNGPLRMSWASNSMTRKFVPVGKDTLYRPLDVSYNHNSSNLSIFHYELKNHGPHYTNIASSANFNHISNKRYWLAERVHGTSTINQAYIGFSWGPSDHVNDYNSINVGKGNVTRTEWNRIQANPSYTGGNTWGFAFVSDNQPANAVDYILASTSALNLLPLSLLDFKLRCDFPFYYTASWITESEYDLDSYLLDYLGSDSLPIQSAVVKAQNVTYERSFYSHSVLLNTPISKVQLWERTLSGYQNLIIEWDAVSCHSDREPFHVFPNPSSVRDAFHIKMNWESLVWNPQIKIFDITGRLVFHKSDMDWENGHILIPPDPGFQKPGMYIIEMLLNQEVFRIKMIRH